MLGKRVISAVVLIPLVGIGVYLGGWVLLALATLVAIAATYEYIHLVREGGHTPSALASYVAVVLCMIDAQWPDHGLLGPSIMLIVLGALVIQVFRGNRPGSLQGWTFTVAGGLYIGLAMSHFVRLRALDNGLLWLATALISTWVCDSGAYFLGMAIGKHRMAPRISPKKTWEGAVGGLVSGVACVWLMGSLLLGLSTWLCIVLGICLVLAATLGDLAESVIKRQVGVKDSGNLIPGHGGALDRVDSLLYVVPTVYYIAVLASGVVS